MFDLLFRILRYGRVTPQIVRHEVSLPDQLTSTKAPASSETVSESSDLQRKMVAGPQIRASRALLGWTAARLAAESGVSYSSVQRAETRNTS
jgi:hypothetical protein